MKSNNKKGLVNLTKTASSIIGAALLALTGINANSTVVLQNENLEANTIKIKGVKKIKPMPVLKLNLNNPDDSKFVASHASHRSHRSHWSHRSFSMI
jgi:hypothetical protein